MPTLFKIGTFYVLDPAFVTQLTALVVSLVQVWRLLILGGVESGRGNADRAGSRAATRCFHVTGVSYPDAFDDGEQRAGAY